MKKLKIILIIILTYSFVASAHRDFIDSTRDALDAVLTKFEAEETHSTVDKFNGFKAWPVSGGEKVKIYLDDNQKPFIQYSCHKHSDADPFECHKTAR